MTTQILVSSTWTPTPLVRDGISAVLDAMERLQDQEQDENCGRYRCSNTAKT